MIPGFDHRAILSVPSPAQIRAILQRCIIHADSEAQRDFLPIDYAVTTLKLRYFMIRDKSPAG